MERSINTLLMIAVMVPLLLVANSNPSDGADEVLSGVYPWSAMYLTYIPLADIATILNDSKYYPKVVASTGNGAAAETLRQFLAQNRGTNIREGVAFVQFDLIRFKVGFKKASDVGLEIQEVGWTPAQVRGVADLCHQFAINHAFFEKVQTALKQKSVDLPNAWTAVKKVEGNIFIPVQRRAELVHEFRRLLDSKGNELTALKVNEPATYEEITKFESAYDVQRTKFEGQLLANQLPLINTRDEVSTYISETYAKWDLFLKAYDSAVTSELAHVTNPKKAF